MPVCLHPAYRAYLDVVTTAAAPLLREMAGLPGAPVRVAEVPNDVLTSIKDSNSTVWWTAGSAITGTPPVFRFPMPEFPPGPAGLVQLTEDVQESLAVAFVNDERLIPPGRDPGDGVQAQAAVVLVLLRPFDQQAGQDVGILAPDQGTPSPAVAAAAQRFAALPAAARHAWLADHLGALRAGQVTLAELP